MHLRPIVAILQLLANRQFEEDDHCCCSNFKYELFITAETRHVRTARTFRIVHYVVGVRK